MASRNRVAEAEKRNIGNIDGAYFSETGAIFGFLKSIPGFLR